jgi:hypothetical protein
MTLNEFDFLSQLMAGGRNMAKRMKATAGMDHGKNDNRGDEILAVQSRPAVSVECPGEGDAIARPSYTFKISATYGVDGVEVSIDQGEWLPCRESLGFWWYDWSGFDAGEHELTARSSLANGMTTNSAPRLFTAF